MALTSFHSWWRAAPPWRRRLRAAVLIVAIIVIAIRMAAPVVLKTVLVHALAKTDGFRGTIDSTAVSFMNLSYVCGPVHLEAVDARNGSYYPLLDAESVSVDADWSDLLTGSIAATLILDRPVYHLYLDTSQKSAALLALGAVRPAKDESAEVASDDPGEAKLERWQDQVSALALFRLDTVTLRNGSVVIKTVDGKDSLHVSELNAGINGLVKGMNPQRAKAGFHLDAMVAESGILHVQGELEPLATQPEFSVTASCEELELKRLNPLTKHFKHLTFKNGHLLAYIELATQLGQVTGTVKPLFRDLDIATYGDDSGSLAVKLFWKAAVPIAENILENDHENQHAAVIPLDGPLESPNTNTWDVLVSIVSNAFIRAIVPGFGKS